MAQLEQEYRDSNDGRRLRIVQAWEAPFGAATVLAPVLAVLSILVALVLVIACANVANLLLSKAVSRRREVAVRLSLGASRTRLVRQLLTESFTLAVIAGVAGVVMAYWTMDVIMAFVPPVDMPIDLGLRMDGTTLVFALTVSLVTGLVFGVAPALQSSGSQTINALKEEGRSGSGGRTTGRLRSALVVAQVAVCLVLLVGATLFLRSFIAAQSLSPGFDASHVVTASMDMFASGYTGDRHREFQRRAVEAVSALPGVQAASFGSRLPLGFGGNSSTSVGVDGYVAREKEEIVINYSTVGPKYFETMGIPIRQGREYNETDTLQSPRTLVINEAMARRYWPQGNALGGRIRLGPNTAEVIGIAGDSKYSSINERPLPQLFFPMSRSEASTLRLFVKTSGDPGPLVAEVRNAIRGLDASLPVYDARTLSEHMQVAVFAQRMAANLLGAMGVLALLLAAIGLYGVMVYAVSQRTQELGIRLALGASPGSLLGMVVRQGMTLTDWAGDRPGARARRLRIDWRRADAPAGHITPRSDHVRRSTARARADSIARQLDTRSSGGEGRSACCLALRVASSRYPSSQKNSCLPGIWLLASGTGTPATLISQRDHWLHSGCPSRRQVACPERDEHRGADGRANGPDVGRRQSE